MAEQTPYQQRAIEQGRLWVAGEAHHNTVDDECCPDFSCCMPDLFTQDRGERVASYNRWAAQYGWDGICDA